MPGERVQRRIDRLLDQAEEAADSADWNKVLEFVAGVLSADPTLQFLPFRQPPLQRRLHAQLRCDGLVL